MLTFPTLLNKVDLRKYNNSLASAIADTDLVGKTLVVTESVSCGDITIPDTISLEIVNGGSVSVNVGATLSINGSFDSYLGDVFTGLGDVVINGPTKVHVVKNVAELKTHSVYSGAIVDTKGYYTDNDGGQARYIITNTGTADGYLNHELANGNIAILQIQDEINVKQCGAKGDGITDDTLPIQAAIDSGKKLFLSEGLYIITSTLNYTADVTRDKGLVIEGCGIQKSFIINEVESGFLLILDQDSASKFHLGSEIKGVSITTNTFPINSSGLRFRASQFLKIYDFEIYGLTGDGIQVLNSTSLDTDQNVNFIVENGEIRDCGGWGINFNYTTNAANGYKLERLRLLRNAGALKLAVANATVQLCSFSESATYSQVIIEHNGLANNYDLYLNNCFFEKGRMGELEINGLIGGNISYNTFSSNDSSSGDYAIKFGYDQAVRGVTFRKNRHIVNSTISTGYSCYDIGTLATLNRILEPEYSDIQSSTKINFASGAENNNNVIEDGSGATTHSPRLLQQRISVSSGTHTPNLLLGSFVQYFATGTGSYTINKPLNGNNDGAEIILGITNQSGGVITVSFGTGITTQNFTSPTNGLHAYARFVYDGVSDVWRQVGSWSNLS